MKVLVTGGGGFLGSAICRQLLDSGHRVVALQRSAATGLLQRGARVVSASITDVAALADAANGCDAVIHTAGKAGVWGAEEDYFHTNLQGTRAVLDACRKAGIRYLVHTSSPSVVHDSGDIEGGNESLPLGKHFLAPYPASKAAAEREALAANRSDLRVTALRPHLIWGPGDPHILPRLAASVRGGKIRLPGADKKIDTVFVENAASAHVLALQELMGQGRCAGKPYFISNDEPLPQAEIISRLLQAIGIEARVVPVSAQLARVAGVICESAWKALRLKSEPPVTRFSAEQLSTAHWYDISAARRDFGYVPEISIEQGLQQLQEATCRISS